MSDISNVQLASNTLSANYSTVAFVAVLLYDYALTFGDEVEFIWRQEMNLGKMLFLLNRYIPIIDLVILMNTYVNPIVHEKFCLPWFQADNWLGLFSVVVIDVLLLLRTWALWRRSMVILISLSLLLVLCVLAASSGVLYASLTVIPLHIPALKNIRPCESTFPKTDILYSLWVSFIIFDSTVLILTLIKALPFTIRFMSRSPMQPNASIPLVTQLLKDGNGVCVCRMFRN